jgi:hypothetical protein
MFDWYTEILLASFDAAVKIGIDFYFYPYVILSKSN